MTEFVLQFSESERIGKIASVDTARALVNVESHDLMPRVAVGKLVAIQGGTSLEYLIGIVERVTRHVREDLLLGEEEDHGEIPLGEVKDDTLRLVLVGTFRSRDGDRFNVFKRGADSFPQIDRDCFVIEAGNLQRLMGLLARDLPLDKRLRLGRFVLDPSALAIADGDRFFQRHVRVLGSTASGKSWTVALLLERARGLQFPNLIVMDMHGEYAPLASSEGFAKRFRVAGPGDLESPDDAVLFLPYWLLNRDEMLAMLLDRSDQNAPNQAARFTTHVRDLKESYLQEQKQTGVLSTFTVDSPIPHDLPDLLRRLTADNTERDYSSSDKGRAGEWNNKLTRFISRLESKIEDRRYSFLFEPPAASYAYTWLATYAQTLLCSDESRNGIKIVDFSEVPSDILPVVVGVFGRLLFEIQFWLQPDRRTPFAIICDEAHLYLPVRDETDSIARRALDTFERIAKEGRKYGISLVVVSQRPADVSRTILNQCNNFLALRLTNDEDQSVVRRLMPDSMMGLTQILPLLDVGEALMLGDAILLPTRLKLDEPSVRPDSATRDFWIEWNTRQPDAGALEEAVETFRRQTRAGI